VTGTNGSICVVEGAVVAGSFTIDINSNLSSETQYHFRGYATNATGTGYTADTTFTTKVAPLGADITFSANRGNIKSGDAVTLTWSAANAQFCSLKSGTIDVDIGSGLPSTTGSIIQTPSKTTIYTLSCTGDDSNPYFKTKEIKVIINPTYNEN
jgi:hypothetical protein